MLPMFVLAFNAISDAGAAAIAKTLMRNQCLQNLNLGKNAIL
jgi:hypothetical protein